MAAHEPIICGVQNATQIRASTDIAAVTAADTAQLLLLAFVWGGSFLFMRVAAPEFGPASLVALRVAIAAVVGGALVLAGRARALGGHPR